MIKRNCKICSKEFETWPCRIHIDKGKYCSRRCSDEVTLIKKGQRISPETEIKKGERRNIKTEFKRGGIPWNWRGGIESENRLIRKHVVFKEWRTEVFERDSYTCKKCNHRGVHIHPHHILNFSEYPKLRFKKDNGITFCEDCHWKFHERFGKRNNNEKQIKEFLS